MTQADLATLIENQINDLTTAWVDAVRADPRIRSDGDLSEHGLRDHIPAVIEEICELLRSGESPGLTNTREARVHTYVRFCQGYRARDLVREMSLLRLTLHDHLTASLSGKWTDVSLDAYAQVLRSINLYIDEELRYAISVYTEATKPHDPGNSTHES